MQTHEKRIVDCRSCGATETRTLKRIARTSSQTIRYEFNQFNETVYGRICAACRRDRKNRMARRLRASKPKPVPLKVGDVREFTCPKCNKTEARTLIEIRRQGVSRSLKWLRPGGFLHSDRACSPCVNARSRAYRMKRETPNTYSVARPYIKTPKGHIIMKYASIRARCLGIDKKNAHIYEGLPFEKKEAFYEWALNHPTFKKLFKAYQESGYRRRLAPSVDRIDTTKGYTFDNMQWLPNHENASRGMLQRWAMYRRGNKSVFGENRNLRK